MRNRRLSRAIPLLMLAAVFITRAEPARADWTWNVGYHNPVVSTWGLNLLYIGQTWGFETGIGWIDVQHTDTYNDDKDKDKDTTTDTNADGSKKKKSRTSIALAGDAVIKYFLTSGKFRPYLQGGVGVGIGAAAGDHAGASAGTGGGFGGIGLLIGSPSFYAYGSYNLGSGLSNFVQAGLGFGL